MLPGQVPRCSRPREVGATLWNVSTRNPADADRVNGTETRQRIVFHGHPDTSSAWYGRWQLSSDVTTASSVANSYLCAPRRRVDRAASDGDEAEMTTMTSVKRGCRLGQLRCLATSCILTQMRQL